MSVRTRAAQLLEKSDHWLRGEIRRRPVIHRVAKEALVGLKLARQRFRRHQRSGSEPQHGWGTHVDRYAVPFAGGDIDAFVLALREHGLEFAEGRHTIYVPPQPGRERLFGAELLAAFPPEAGIKLLKNFAPPSQARYQYESGSAAEAALLGPIGNQVFAAAALYAYDLGPRPLDLVHLRGARAGVDMTAMICEHVAGQVPSKTDYDGFITRLRAIEDRGLFQFAHPSRYECNDFFPPDCNGNLITSADGPRYVDPQVFLFDEAKIVADVLAQRAATLHFGDVLSVVQGGERFLYQEVPGATTNARRGTDERWVAIDQLLSRHQVSLTGQLLFDVCCNSGMMMHGALARGAHWAFGWDLPAVADSADHLLPLLGSGRTSVYGRQLALDTDLRADLPDWAAQWCEGHGGVCMFLAAWHHISFPPGIGDLPWTWMVYEGQENELMATTDDNVATMAASWRAREVERIVIRDGLCGPRPVVLMRRIDDAG